MGRVVGISGVKTLVRGADVASENVTVHTTTALDGTLLPPRVSTVCEQVVGRLEKQIHGPRCTVDKRCVSICIQI